MDYTTNYKISLHLTCQTDYGRCFALMVKKKKARKALAFPRYLRHIWQGELSSLARKWLAQHLKKTRDQQSLELAAVAQSAGVNIAELEAVEKGRYYMSLGQFRDVLKKGYGVSLEEILVKFCDENRVYFRKPPGPRDEKPFERDYYRVRWQQNPDDRGSALTQFLVGGDPKRFLWAVPIRRLQPEQSATVEILELAPQRTRKGLASGQTVQSSHEGEEIIHVIYGKVDVFIEPDHDRPLAAGDSIHFHSSHRHSVRNRERNNRALLLVVRVTPKTADAKGESAVPSVHSETAAPLAVSH